VGLGLIAAAASLHGLAHGAETPETGFAGYAAGADIDAEVEVSEPVIPEPAGEVDVIADRPSGHGVRRGRRQAGEDNCRQDRRKYRVAEWPTHGDVGGRLLLLVQYSQPVAYVYVDSPLNELRGKWWQKTTLFSGRAKGFHMTWAAAEVIPPRMRPPRVGTGDQRFVGDRAPSESPVRPARSGV